MNVIYLGLCLNLRTDSAHFNFELKFVYRISIKFANFLQNQNSKVMKRYSQINNLSVLF